MCDELAPTNAKVNEANKHNLAESAYSYDEVILKVVGNCDDPDCPYSNGEGMSYGSPIEEPAESEIAHDVWDEAFDITPKKKIDTEGVGGVPFSRTEATLQNDFSEGGDIEQLELLRYDECKPEGVETQAMAAMKKAMKKAAVAVLAPFMQKDMKKVALVMK